MEVQVHNMSDQNNNQDNWSNRNWQDASQFGGGGKSSFGFGGGSRDNGFFGGNQGGQDDPQRGMGGMSLFGNSGNGKIGGGWMKGRNSTFVIIIVLIIVIIYTFYTQISMNSNITRSTIERTKIETQFDSKKDPCFTDEYNVVEDEGALRNAINEFHNKTGVIPYVYFVPSEDKTSSEELTRKAEAFYKENFEDQDHFVIFFDGLQGAYYLGTSIGENAKTVLDAEAQQIFTDYLDKFYAARQTNNQSYMVNTLLYSSERIMSTLPYSQSTLIFGIIIIALLIFVIIISIKRKNEAVTDGQASERIER